MTKQNPALSFAQRHRLKPPVALSARPRYRLNKNAIEITIRLHCTAEEALYWVSTERDGRRPNKGRIMTGLQVVTHILQMLRYLGETRVW